MNALELHDVVKYYGRHQALAGLDLQVPVGSIFGLVGSNGAGKTTAMAVSAGLLQATSGKINLLGQGPFTPATHTGRISLLPQDSRMPLHSHVDELLMFYGRLQGLAEGALQESVDNVLDWVHLQDRRNSAVRTLSHGMMRRLTIAQAFLGHPELVLLDEPMSGLDPREASRVRHILLRRRGMQTIVISSHNLHELETLCDRAAFIEHGKLVRQDTIDSITRRGHSVTYKLLPGNIPIPALQKALPDTTIEGSTDGTILTIKFQGDPDEITRINAKVLEILLHSGIGVIEIRRGSDLESEYLAATS
ncbi:MAG: ABC transporter ATP-binding protein [Kiritimatiellae bacterium]|nr:ABC transporter ATP-binding protein [Kiritimatiellia bacterium]